MIILIVAVAAVTAAGSFLRWAVTPCVVAFRVAFKLGRSIERIHPLRPGVVPAFRVGYRFGRGDRSRTR